MKEVNTITANIYIGFRAGYGDYTWPPEVSYHILESALQEYTDKVGLCVTVTRTNFIYKDGNEVGAIVGLINYPRFPSTETEILNHSTRIASILKVLFKQNRVSVVMNNKTYMIGE